LKTNNYVVEIEQDPKTGDLILPIPTDLLNQMGWSEGTDLWWVVEDDKIILKENSHGTSETQ
jgi:hypothetical protein